jgi:phage terminase large subunit-like protein
MQRLVKSWLDELSGKPTKTRLGYVVSSAPKKRRKPAEKEIFRWDLVAESYVSDVLLGKIPACKWVKLACDRHKRDLASSISKAFPYEFDAELANKACERLSRMRYTRGQWRGERFKIEPWQAFITCSIFGWVKKTDRMRRFHKARIYVPRKNGKSEFSGALGIIMMAFDGEPGAEVYAGATSEKQAMEVYQAAKQMALLNPALCAYAGITVTAGALVVEKSNSKFSAIIGKPGDGASPHCAIIDEFHEHKTSELIDTMETGMGARRQPLSFVISTAGADTAGPCREDWKNCERILENTGGFEDETTFCIIWTIDQDDKWDSEAALIKANPNWGVSINAERILAELKVAQQSARKQSAFKTKYLNQWVTAKDGFFNVSEWEKLKRDIKREDYKDMPCYLAGDLASKHDLVALMQLFCLPDKRYAIFGKYYLPNTTLDLPENQHYRNWQIQGRIEAAGDDVTDLDSFKSDALDLCRDYQVEEFPFDPNRAWGVFPALEREGLPVVEYRNTVLTMSEPMKELDALIRSGRIIHNGDPVLAWSIANVTGKYDKKDNVFPNKEAPQNKIDPVVGTLMALGRAMTRTGEESGPFFSFG